MKTQSFPIGDSPGAETLQRNFRELYDYAHTHDVIGYIPSASDGGVGEIRLATISGVDYLYVKFKSGWKRFVSA